mgnify:FL=1
MKRLTTDTPDGNFETVLNFVYGKDGWAYIRHDGEHEDVLLTDWAKRQCFLRGCDEVFVEKAEEIDQQLCDCMMDAPICPIALAYCFASQAVHLRGRLKMYEDAMPLERAQELARAEKDGRLVVLPCKLHESIFYLEDGELFDDEPYEVSLGQKSGEWNDSLMFECQYGFGFFGEDVGKTVFLTRAEAEAALKERGERQ